MKHALCIIVVHLLLFSLSGSLCDCAAKHEQEEVEKKSYQVVAPAAGMVIAESKLDFETTWSNLITALEDNANIRIVATIDHTAAAQSVGLLDLTHPIRLVVFGNPNLGTPLMQEQLMTGIDLPQKMLVWQDDNDGSGKVYVGYNSVEYLDFRHAGIKHADSFSTIKTALANLAMMATGQPKVDDDAFSSSIQLLQGHGGLRTRRSDADFETTWTRLLDAIEASPANIAFTVDHSQNSGGVLNPSRLVVFGNPNLGTPLMQTSATAGIDLPLKILVWEDDNGYVKVTRNSINFLKTRHGLGSTNLDSIEMAIQNFVRVATQSE